MNYDVGVKVRSGAGTFAAPKQLLGIQAARGIAALLVVLSHCEHMLALPQYVGHFPLGGMFRFGHAGVDFFSCSAVSSFSLCITAISANRPRLVAMQGGA